MNPRPITRHVRQAIHASPSARVNELRRNMNASVADAAAFSLMVGLGESYLAAFALAIGLGEVIAGLVATIPILLGSLLQLVSPYAVQRLGSLRRWVVVCAVTQALALTPLAWAALRGHISAAGLMLIATVYWAAGLATGPAWNTWVGRLFPRRIRAPFLAMRSRMAQVTAVAGLVAAGLSLHYGSEHGLTLRVFAALFIAAAVARFVSAVMLWLKTEPPGLPPQFRVVSLREMTARLREGGEMRLLTYMLTVSVAVQISGPFFTPYMLKQLHFSYAEYLTLIATSFVSKALALPIIGRIAQKHGARAILWTGGVGIVPLSGFWMLGDNFTYLLAIQVFSGAIWAMYELATLLLLFDHIRESERTSVLTMYNAAHAFAMTAGSLIGGAALQFLGEAAATYQVIFGMSVGGRALTLGLLFALVAPRYRPLPIDFRRFAVRVITIRPSMGSIDRPVLPAMTGVEENEIEAVTPRREDATVSASG